MIIVLSALCAVFAGIFLYTEIKKKFLIAVFWKGLASVCFVTIGLLSGFSGHIQRFVILGLIVGLIADVLLNLRFVLVKQEQLVFILGILFFLAGHIFYLAAILPMVANLILCIIIAVVLTILTYIWMFKFITVEPVMKVFGVIYMGVNIFMNTAAVYNLIMAPSVFTGIFAAGAVLFLVSDIILIFNTFGEKHRDSFNIWNIVLYYTGQVLIGISLKFL